MKLLTVVLERRLLSMDGLTRVFAVFDELTPQRLRASFQFLRVCVFFACFGAPNRCQRGMLDPAVGVPDAVLSLIEVGNRRKSAPEDRFADFILRTFHFRALELYARILSSVRFSRISSSCSPVSRQVLNATRV